MSDQFHISIGGGILDVLRAQRMDWSEMIKEWVDNSFGARAKNVTLRWSGETFEVADDGEGCEDLRIMESPGKSGRKPYDNAGKFGIGGVWAQIRASQAGLVEIISFHVKHVSKVTLHWGKFITKDDLSAEHFQQLPPTKPTGTIIRIPKLAIGRPSHYRRLIEDLGHAYKEEIVKRGRKIVFDVDGKISIVEPYKPPKFEYQKKFQFEYQGHQIHGFCGIVPHGVKLRFPGWSVFWGYRMGFTTNLPAGETRIVKRIYAEVYLPRTWENISPTKDGFSVDDDGLWETVGEHCKEIIEKADEQSYDLELQETAEIVNELLTGAIAGNSLVAKGRRPGSNGENGTVEPSGNGSPHRSFETAQEGYKDSDPTGKPCRMRGPSRIRITWEMGMEYPYEVEIRKGTMFLTLDKSREQIARFMDDPLSLAVLCCGYIAQEMETNPETEGMFPIIRGENIRDTYGRLLSRIKVAPCLAAETV